MEHAFKQVRDFHEAFNIPIRDNIPAGDEVQTQRREFRIRILREEFNEYTQAERNDDIIEIADALGDMIYVILGTALEYGIDLPIVFNEIHRSNMTKLDKDGKPITRADGKIIKSNLFERPKIAVAIFHHEGG